MSVLDNLKIRMDTLGQSLLQRAEPLLVRYRELPPREQVVVAVGLLVVLLTLTYLVLWEPFALARLHQQTELADERALAERLETIAAAVTRARASGLGAVQGREQSLLTLVDQAGRLPELGKAPTRIQPEGEKEVKLWFEDVPFDPLSQWVNTLETRYGVVVSNADVERRAGSGLVNARLTVSRP